MARTDVFFDSDALPVGKRLAGWRDLVGDHLVNVEMLRASHVPAERAYSGTMSLKAFSSATFAHVRSANQALHRTPGRIRGADRETALLTLVLAGECRIAQDDRRVALRPGDLCLYDSVRPYQIEAPGAFEVLVVTADRGAVEASLGNLRALTAVPLRSEGAAGLIAARFWRDLALRVADLNEAAISRFVRCGFDMTGAALAEIAGGAPHGLSCAFALQRAKAFMAENFHRPGLSPVEIAGAAGLSVRRLQELFQAEGETVTGCLRAIRMAAAKARLGDPALSRQSIASVMQSVGLSDQARFSRAFRGAFGASPREFRRGER